MANNKLKTGHIRFKVGPIEGQGHFALFVLAIPLGLGGYAGFRWIKGLFDGKDEKRRYLASSDEVDGQDEKAVSLLSPPTVLTHEDINGMSGVNYERWQLVGKLIGIEDIAILYCEPGLGKSVMSHQIACDIATGRKSLIATDDAGEHNPQWVFYYDSEMTKHDYQRRYPNFEAPDRMKILIDFYYKDEKDWVEDLEQRLSDIQGDAFVVLDNITSAFKNMTAEEMRYFLTQRLRTIQDKRVAQGYHVTFLIIAHTTKEGILAGVANFQNFGTSILHLKSANDNDHVMLAVDKDRNYGEMHGKHFLLRKSEEGGKHFEFVKELTDDERPANIPQQKEAPQTHTPHEPKYKELSDDEVMALYEEINKSKEDKAAGRPYKRQQQIADEFGIPEQYISRKLKRVPGILAQREASQQETIGQNTGETEAISPETDE